MTGRMPANFGAWEHLIKIIANFHNWRVRDFFRHERYDSHIRDPRIDRPVNNLMQACIIRRNDSAVIVLVRLVFFEICLGNAARLQPGIYGIPARVWDEYTFDNRPKVFMLFEEDVAPIPTGYSRIQAEVSFRIMNETPESMTKGKAESLANKIKTAFGTVPTWSFTKGKNIYTYEDKKLGYDFRIRASTESDAEQLIKKCLSIQGHTYEIDRFKVSDGKKQSDNNTGSITIMGQTYKKRRYRPVAIVRFRYASLNIPGVDPVSLYDPYYRLNQSPLTNSR